MIKFTATWLPFGHTSLVKNSRFETNLHVTPMDTHQYLQADSCHPKHCKTAIPLGQTLCFCRICSEQDNLQKRCQELKHHLIKRGYDEQQLDSEIQQALDIPRETDSQPHNDQEKSACIPLVATYHPTLPSSRIATRQHLNIIHMSERLQKALPLPPLIAFHCLKNLRDFLVRAELTANSQRAPGIWHCDTARCKMCPILMTKVEFASHTTG